MPRIRAEYVFEVDSAWFATGVLGARFTFTRGKYEATIEIPGNENDFGVAPHSVFKGFLLPASDGRALMALSQFLRYA